MEANAKVTNNSTLGEFQSLSSGKDSYCVILATMVHSPSLLPLHNVVLCSVEHFQSRCCVCKGGEIGQTFGPIISDQVWSDHIGLSSCVIGENQGVWLDWLHNHSVHSLGHPWLPSFLLSLCLVTEEKPPTVCGKENIFLSLPCQVFGTLCMAVGSSLRCLPLLFPALKSSFTGCCHAGKYSSSSS